MKKLNLKRAASLHLFAIALISCLFIAGRPEGAKANQSHIYLLPLQGAFFLWFALPKVPLRLPWAALFCAFGAL